MNSKTIVKLILALAVLALAARLMRSSSSSTEASSGKALAVDLAAVEKFIVTHGTQSVTIARQGNSWRIQSLWNYPADFDRISENIRQLGEIKGEPIRDGENHLDEFGLVSTHEDYVAIAFADGAGKELGTFELGSPRLSKADGMGGYPNGQYVRASGGPVLLAGEYLGSFPRQPEDWAVKTLLSVDASELSYVMVRVEDQEPYGLLSETGGVWTLSDLKDGEETRQDVAENVARALSSLTLESVADPALAPEISASSFIAKTTNGTVYAINTRESQARINVSFEGDDTNEVARAAAENERLSTWVYILPPDAIQHLTTTRDQLASITTNAVETTTPSSPPPALSKPAN